jgi:hypothetical protein
MGQHPKVVGLYLHMRMQLMRFRNDVVRSKLRLLALLPDFKEKGGRTLPARRVAFSGRPAQRRDLVIRSRSAKSRWRPLVPQAGQGGGEITTTIHQFPASRRWQRPGEAFLEGFQARCRGGLGCKIVALHGADDGAPRW